jgi:hypothetical protein
MDKSPRRDRDHREQRLGRKRPIKRGQHSAARRIPREVENYRDLTGDTVAVEFELSTGRPSVIGHPDLLCHLISALADEGEPPR